MKYKQFELTEFQRGPGKWRVAIKRLDGVMRWFRLSEQIFRVDKWKLCHG
jgi:uncharacterized protein (DUF2249 family)